MKTIAYLVLVLAILGVGFWLLTRGGIDDSRGSQRDIAADVIRHGLDAPIEAFRKDFGRYPTTEEGLAALLVCPPRLKEQWKGPYIAAKGFPSDPWMREYRYGSPGIRNPTSYDLWSLGPDGIESDDDIGNWKK